MLDVFLHGSPDQAVLLAVAGMLLIYVELNRPGLVLPGSLGLLILLFSISALLPLRINAIAVALLAASVCIHVLSLRKQILWPGAIAAGASVFGGCYLLVSSGQGEKVHLPECVTAGLLLGPGTSLLTAIARRARTNKGLDLNV